MLEKSRTAVFFQWFVCWVSRKVGLLKRRARSHVVRGEIKNCTPLWRKAHFEVKMYKRWCWKIARRCGEKHILKSKCAKHHSWAVASTFWSSDVEKRRCGEKHILPLWRCRKIARRCGEKHIMESKFKKLTVSEHFLKFSCLKISQLASSSVNQSVN